MIEFSDRTLISSGACEEVRKIMKEADGADLKWMIRSHVLIYTDQVMSNNIVHFWHDGRAVIMETDHPPFNEVPEDDIIELGQWAKDKGWTLHISNDLIEDHSSFHFWLRFFRTGHVYNAKLEEYEKDEIRRFEKSFTVNQEED